MDLTEIKSANGRKSNRIVLKDLSKRQKELFMSGGIIAAGVGIGSGLFSLYSMNNPEIIPESISNHTASAESVEESVVESSPAGDLAFFSDMPVASMVQNDVSFAEAFEVARHEVGAGGWFIWNEKVYNSYYKEEWENLSSDEKNSYLATLTVEEIVPEPNTNVEPNLAAVADEVVIDEKAHEEHIQNSVKVTEALGNIITETEVSHSEPEISFVADDTVQINMEGIDQPREFELPEDAVIFEIPSEDLGTLESIVIDANEYNLLDEREETPENMAPIVLKNVGDNAVAEPIGLQTNRFSEVTEYPWGEPIIKSDHPSEGLVSNEKTDVKIEVIQGNDTLNKEVTEYPWGESMVKSENISFANDIKVIDAGELVTDNMNVIPDQANVTDEYPWGEPMVKSSDTQAFHVNKINESEDSAELNNPTLDVDNATDSQTNE